MNGDVHKLWMSNPHDTNVKTLHFECQVACPFSIATECAEEFLDRHEQIRVPVLRFGALKIGINRSIATGIVVARDASDNVRWHEALEIWLHPVGMPPFPEIHGLLTVRPFIPPGTRIALDLSYRPPLGVLGRIVDRLALHVVASAIGQALLDDICVYLASPRPQLAPSQFST